MNKYSKNIISLIIYTILMVVPVVTFAADSLMSKIATPNEATNFKLLDRQGKEVSLSDYKGKFVLINFWAQWCGPCVKEMPDMEEMYKELKDKDFEIIAIHAGPFDQNVDEFLADKKITFTVVSDEKTNIKGWKVPVLPISYLVSPNGLVTHKAHGAVKWSAKSMLSLMSAHN